MPTPGPTDYFNDVEKELAVRTGSRGHKKAPAYTFAKQHLVGSLAAGANGNASTPGPGEAARGHCMSCLRLLPNGTHTPPLARLL